MSAEEMEVRRIELDWKSAIYVVGNRTFDGNFGWLAGC